MKKKKKTDKKYKNKNKQTKQTKTKNKNKQKPNNTSQLVRMLQMQSLTGRNIDCKPCRILLLIWRYGNCTLKFDTSV